MIPDRHQFALTMLRMFRETENMRQAHLALLASDLSSMRSNWIYVYNWLVSEKKLEPIENIERASKVEIWQHANEIAPNLTRDQLAELSKCLYTIEYYLNLEP